MYDTEKFITYLTTIVNGEKEFKHGYYDEKRNLNVHFSSLANALEQYYWTIPLHFREITSNHGTANANYTNYVANEAVLNHLSNKIKSAQTDNDLFKSSIEILEWGGVANKYNRAWLNNAHNNLANLYKDTQQAFEEAKYDEFGPSFRSNAGFTKIYSLKFDNFVIYDSRVAAALGLLVVGYCKENSKNTVPPNLQFKHMPARGQQIRNASIGGLRFYGVNNNQVNHAQSNFKANKILCEVVSKVRKDSPFYKDARKLEAALFMVGYDLKMSPLLRDNMR